MQRKPVILAALLIAAFAINLDTTIVNVALPSLVRELHASTSQLQWVVDAYNLVFAALLLTAGSLSDRLGRKGVLLSGLAVFAVSSLAGALTTSPGALIAARLAMGVGAAMIFPATLSLIANIFTERVERARAIGLWGATAGLAVALGPLVGGWLLEHFAWPSIFYALIPVAILAGVLVAVSVPTSRDETAPAPDGPGFLLSTAAMGVLVFTIIEAPTHGWGATATISGFAGAAVLVATFIWWERRTETPMLDVALFRNLRFTAASGSVTVAFFALFGFIFLMTQYFQFIRSFGPLSTGVHLLPVATSVAVGSVLGTRLAVRLGTKLIVTAGLVATTIFYLWVAADTAGTSYGFIAIQMVVYGLGMGFTAAPATEAIMGAVSTAKAGVGSAINDATRLLGGTLGVAVIGSVYASVFGRHLATALPSQLPASVAAVAHQSVGAALAVAGRLHTLGFGAAAATLHHGAVNAFVSGLRIGCLVAGGVAAIGAVAAAWLLPAQPPAAVEEATGDAHAARSIADVGGAPLSPVPDQASA